MANSNDKLEFHSLKVLLTNLLSCHLNTVVPANQQQLTSPS